MLGLGLGLGLGLAGGAHGWVVGRAGFWDVLATWVWGWQLQPLGSWAPNLHVRLRRYPRVLNVDSIPALKVLDPLMGSIMFASIRIIPFNTIPLTYRYKVQMVEGFN